MYNSITWGNTPDQITGSGTTFFYSLIQNCGGSGIGWNTSLGADGGGNLDANPQFLDADGADNIAGTLDDDLRLLLTSPAIDAGDNTAITADTFDLDIDGDMEEPIPLDLAWCPRFVDVPFVPDTGLGMAPIVDMGAYEVQLVDVALIQTVSPTAAMPGEMITFTLTFANSGSITATQVIISDSIPAFFSATSVLSAGVSITDTGHAQPYVWAVQDLAPGQGGVITLTGHLAVPQTAGVYTNTATIAAVDDVWTANNLAEATFTVIDVAPTLTSIPIITATQDVHYTYLVAAQDANGSSGLAFTAPTLPAWLALVDHGDGTATLSGTPGSTDVGDHAVILRVTDSGGLAATQSFTIVVANVNDAPTFTSTPVTAATQGTLYSYAVATNDSDLIWGDALILTAPTLPAWLTLVDHGDGAATLSGTPGNTHIGNHTVVLRVADGGGLTATQTFTVTVARIEYSIYLPLVVRNVP